MRQPKANKGLFKWTTVVDNLASFVTLAPPSADQVLAANSQNMQDLSPFLLLLITTRTVKVAFVIAVLRSLTVHRWKIAAHKAEAVH